MKAFVLGLVAVAVVTTAAWFLLTDVVGDTAAEASASDAVRLGEAGPAGGDPLAE